MLQNRVDCDFIVDMNHGANCYATFQNGACYNPNTMKSHCDYVVNSYFQKKGLASGSFDFAGTATQTQNNPCKFLRKIF